jgi:two-component system CheB/CheR fusion protein
MLNGTSQAVARPGAAEADLATLPRARTGGPAPFPIIGIGASAGGLEALEQFLRNVPERTDMGFVVVQHLDPTHKAILVELLQRVCKMPVVQVKDRMRVEAGRVHVIPPNRDMSILHGVLHLFPMPTTRGLPIDFFFRSLAEDRGNRAIGVVLSGMGSDGTLGLAAIKEKGGATFAQSLASAKFTGMPRSAADAGLVDVVAPVEELPGRILAFLHHTTTLRPADAALEDKQHSALEKVFILLRAHTGNDFSQYKRNTIYRRVERRMGLHQIDKLSSYVRFLRDNPNETELLFKELLIGVTSFFRDAPAWEQLKEKVVPELLDAREGNRVLRGWVPGCSTGEEAYSLAMVLKEAMADRKHALPLTIQIFATDLDTDAIERARLGIYPASIAADVSPERLRRFFVQDERGYRVSKDIREAVVFAPQNAIMDPPFTKLDILCCRNLLIYLSPELQKKVIPLYHYALNPRGILFLGSAETVGAFGDLFNPLDGKTRIYRRADSAAAALPVEFPASFGHPVSPDASVESRGPPRASSANLQSLADRVIVQRFAPASILTTDKGEIIYIGGRTGKYLEPAVGRANLNVFAMAREGLRYELSAAFASALRENRPVTVRGVRVGTNGGAQGVDVTVEKLSEPRDLRGSVMIVITDVASTPELPSAERARRVPTSARIAALERELQQGREEIQTAHEEMQTSQEELKSTNEELQSTNEELQSTNEELTTSKEEMQSMNEELQTVNHELQAKVDELSRSNNDMKNLLNSTDIATLFLNGELLVRGFTVQTTKLIKLIPGDTGRPITDIATELEYPQLVEDAREVLRTLKFKERPVAATDGRWFTVRILPYRTLENVIDGVVITFTDVTETKRLEASLRQQASELAQMTESLPTLVWGCRADGDCNYLGPQWRHYTGMAEADGLGNGWLGHVHPDDRERVREEWRRMARSGAALDTEFRIRGAAGAYRWFTTRSAPIRDAHGSVSRWYATSTDVDDLKRGADARQRVADVFAAVVDDMGDGFLAVDESATVTALNAAAERTLGRGRDEVLGKPLSAASPAFAAAGLDDEIQKVSRERGMTQLEVAGEGGRWLRLRVIGHAGGAALYVEPYTGGTPA